MDKKNVYIGHRYVPLLDGEWDKKKSYEGLTIVTYQGGSYTSKKRVPVGIDISNKEYWVHTGNYNAQVEQYRKDVRDMEDRVNGEMATTLENVNTRLKETTNYVDNTLVTVNEQLDQTEKVTNVLSFNAVGDDSNDDTIPIQNAINHAKETGLNRVNIPKGVYRFSELRIPEDVIVYGEGTLSLNTSSTTPIIMEGESVLDGITIQGNQSNHVYNHQVITAIGNNVLIKNCKFTNCYDKVIVLDLGSDYSIVRDCKFNKNGFTGNCNAISVLSSYTKVLNNMFLDHGNGHSIRTGTFVGESTGKAHYVLISGNTFKNLEHNAITIEFNSRYITIVDNHIENCPQAIKAEGEVQGVSHVYASGNYMKNIHLPTAFNLLKTSDCVVKGNTLIDSAGPLSVGDRSVVEGNSVENSAGGITGRENTVISNNTINNCTLRPINQYSGSIVNNIVIDCTPSDTGHIIRSGRNDHDVCSIKGNQIINPKPVNLNVSCIMVRGKGVIVSDNVIRDSNRNGNYGVYVAGESLGYIVKDNTCEVALSAFYATEEDVNAIQKDNLKL